MAHRQQFYYWKNYRNNRLKHILPRPLPEPPVAPPAPAPPQQPMLPVTAPTIAMPAAPAPVLSPMQYANPQGSSLAKTDMRNSAVDRRKRKYVHLIKDSILCGCRIIYCWQLLHKRKKCAEKKKNMLASILRDMFFNCYRKEG